MRSRTLAIGWVLVLLGFLVGAQGINDNSLLTHVASGRLIISGFGVPDTDPFSHTALGETWTVQSWLPASIYALIDRWVGGSGLRTLHGLAGALIGAGLWRLVRPAGREVQPVVLASVPLIIGLNLWAPRPFLFGVLGLVGVLLVVRDRRPGWLLVPIFWLWANSHGSFPLGVAVIALAAIGAIIDSRAGGATIDSRPGGGDTRRVRSLVAYLAWSIVGCIVGAFGPLGYRLWLFPLKTVSRRDALAGVREWEPPGYDSPGQLLWLALVVFLVLWAARGPRWEDLVPALAFAAAGILSVRNIVPASVVMASCMALGGSTRSLDTSRPDRLPSPSGRSSRSAPDSGGRGPWPAVSAVAGLGLVLAIGASPWLSGYSFDRYPEDEVDWLADAGLLNEADPIVHRDVVGNYLTWRFGSEARVFIDDRFDMYPLAVIEDHRALLSGRDPGEVLERRGAALVIWEQDSALASWLEESSRWMLALDNDEWIVACRTGSRCSEEATRGIDRSEPATNAGLRASN